MNELEQMMKMAADMAQAQGTEAAPDGDKNTDNKDDKKDEGKDK
jgi:hypothetical protein